MSKLGELVEVRTKWSNKMMKLRPKSDAEFKRRLFSELLNFVRGYKVCQDCGNPVIDGYCCNYCGSSTPETKTEFGIDKDGIHTIEHYNNGKEIKIQKDHIHGKSILEDLHREGRKKC